MAAGGIAGAKRSGAVSPQALRGPDGFERVLAAGALILLGFVIAAILRGQGQWAAVPGAIWVHLALMIGALALTPAMLLRRRGDRLHRRLGTIWAALMLATAFDSLLIREVNRGGFSLIHLLSLWVIIQVPLIWWSARTHRVRWHRSTVRAMVLGALIAAGAFTFPFDRLLGHWLFG